MPGSITIPYTLPVPTIDSVNVPDPHTTENLFNGPLKIGNNLYCLGKQQPIADPPNNPLNRPAIYMSSDRGQTWVEIGGVYAGTLPAGIATAGGFQWAWSERFQSNIITFVFVPNDPAVFDGSWRLQDFNLDTQTWSVEYGLNPGPNRVPNRNPVIVRMSDGTIKFVAGHSDANLYLSVCSPLGAWTVVDAVILTDLSPGFGLSVDAICRDTTDTIHVLGESVSVTTRYQQYVNVDNTNTPASAQIVFTVPIAVVDHCFRIFLAQDGNLYFAWFSTGAATGSQVNVMIGEPNPSLITPLFIPSIVFDTFVIDNTFANEFLFLSDINGTLTIVVQMVVTGAVPIHEFYYVATFDGLTWSTGRLLYDASLNPPTSWGGVNNPLNNGMSIAPDGQIQPSGFNMLSFQSYVNTRGLDTLFFLGSILIPTLAKPITHTLPDPALLCCFGAQKQCVIKCKPKWQHNGYVSKMVFFPQR